MFSTLSVPHMLHLYDFNIYFIENHIENIEVKITNLEFTTAVNADTNQEYKLLFFVYNQS